MVISFLPFFSAWRDNFHLMIILRTIIQLCWALSSLCPSAFPFHIFSIQTVLVSQTHSINYTHTHMYAYINSKSTGVNTVYLSRTKHTVISSMYMYMYIVYTHIMNRILLIQIFQISKLFSKSKSFARRKKSNEKTLLKYLNLI